mmetsp:Transcript_39434/g.93543  ORF Transcript_39434/g.93543 Transcript_39434/m.93543 type:complete len:236 (+) Transcript_39434:865-1572(+)
MRQRWQQCPPRSATPLTVMVPVPAPEILPPILARSPARATTSGSRAAFLIVVSPSARHAVIMRHSVAPTLGNASSTAVPVSLPLARTLSESTATCLRAHCPQPLDVQVDGSRANVAAAWKSDLRFARPRQQRPQDQETRSESPDGDRCWLHGAELRGVDAEICAGEFRGGANGPQDSAHAADVREARHTGQHHGALSQDGGCHKREGGVLRSADLQLTPQRTSTIDLQHLQARAL